MKMIKISLLLCTVYISAAEIGDFIIEDLPEEKNIEEKITPAFEAFYCYQCQKIIQDKEQLNLKFHMKNAHATCWACNISFPFAQDVQEHFMQEHNDENFLKSCATAECVINYIKKKKKQKVQTFEAFYCPECSAIIQDKREFDLNYHLENTHKICRVCKVSFPLPKDVRAHFMQEHCNKSSLKTHNLLERN